MRTIGIQPTFFNPRFGNVMPKVANRFDIDLSEADKKFHPLINQAINQFNQSSTVRKNRLKNVPDGIKYKFVSDEYENIMVIDSNNLVSYTIPKKEGITLDNLKLGIRSVSQGLIIHYL